MVIAIVVAHLSILIFDSILIQFWLYLEEKDETISSKIKLNTRQVKTGYKKISLFKETLPG